jgi:hypothetical protein
LIKPIASRGVLAVVPATMVLALAALIHCGSDSSNGDVVPAGDDGGEEGSAFGEGGAGDTGVTCKAVGATCVQGTECCVGACTSGLCGGNVGDAGAKACNMADAVCAKGFDCCSGTCNGGKCVGNTLVSGGGDGGAGSAVACIGATTACTTGNQCCSGLCEPVTGMAGVIQCRDACRADGVSCVDAQDCCTLACNNGTCGGTICKGGERYVRRQFGLLLEPLRPRDEEMLVRCCKLHVPSDRRDLQFRPAEGLLRRDPRQRSL